MIKISKEWLKKENNTKHVIRYYALLNRFYEKHYLPAFNIVPICKIGAHFMTIDTYALYGIMKDLKIINCNEKVFVEFSDDHWKSF